MPTRLASPDSDRYLIILPRLYFDAASGGANSDGGQREDAAYGSCDEVASQEAKAASCCGGDDVPGCVYFHCV